jgi:hypothetical protein
MNEKQIAANRRMIRNIEPDAVDRFRVWKARSTFAQPTGNETPRNHHTTFHGFSAVNTLEVKRLPTRIRKNRKMKTRNEA